MAQDPKKTLQTLDEYAYRQDAKDNPIKALRSGGIGVVVGFIGFVVVVCFVFYLQVASPEAKRAQADLEREFHLISHPPNAVPHDYYASHKLQHALVMEKYVTPLSYKELRSYYDNELPKDGWKFVKQKLSDAEERSSGEKILYYRKGNYIATVEYERDAGYTYTYAFSLSWGLDNDL